MISPTAGDIAIMTRTLLVHTYTRTPVSDGSDDAWGEAGQTPGSASLGRACLYQEADQPRTTEAGKTTVTVPTLFVEPSDALAVGDQVSVVTDRSGTVIKSGPFLVESVEREVQLGPTLLKRCVLKAGDVR